MQKCFIDQSLFVYKFFIQPHLDHGNIFYNLLLMSLFISDWKSFKRGLDISSATLGTLKENFINELGSESKAVENCHFYTNNLSPISCLLFLLNSCGQ